MPSAPAPVPGYAALLRRRGYPSFVLTVVLARITTTMFTTSGVLLVLARTHSSSLAGITAGAGTIATGVGAPLLGAWLDVAPRRRALIVGDNVVTVAALIVFLLLAGHAPDWTLPVCAVLRSFSSPLSSGGFQSTLAVLAGDELLDRASTIEATSLNFSFVIGPALAGILAGAFSPALAIEVQAAATLLVIVLVAINPAFEARAAERPARARDALRQSTAALRGSPRLVRTSIASVCAIFGWGLMIVGFPIYAARTLHAGAHAGGYLWAGLAAGSIVGTFALARDPTPRRMALSYLVLGLSALLWLLAGSLLAGIALVTLTGVLEGPAYTGTIALRQRLVPPAVRAGVMTTVTTFAMLGSSAGSIVAGALDRPAAFVAVFLGTNLVAAAVTYSAREGN